MEDEKDDLSGLSEAERASLAEDDDLKDLDALLDEAGDEGDAEDDGEAEPKAEAEAEAEEEVEAKGEDEGESGAQADLVANQDATTQAQPDYTGLLADLDRKFEDGDITMAEYLSQRDALNEHRIASRVRVELAEATREQAWQAANAKFFADHPEYAADHSRLRFIAMQAAVEDVAAANAQLPYDVLLAKAKERVDAEFGIKPAKADDKPEGKPKLRVVGDRRNTPPSLKDIPAAAASDVGGGEFSNLESLSGIELEAAVARLSPEQQARWAEAG